MIRNRGVWMPCLLFVSSACATKEVPSGSDETTGHAIESIVLERASPTRGFCPTPNQFIDASFTRNEANELMLGGTIFRAYEKTADCPDDFCLVTEDIASFALEEVEATRLGELAIELRATRDQEAFFSGSCEGERDPGCDPCLVGELTIDGVSHEDNSCVDSPCGRYVRKLQELEGFIDGLAPPRR